MIRKLSIYTFFTTIVVLYSNFIYTRNCLANVPSGKNGYSISVTCKPYKNITVSLAHYFGEEFVIDTIGRLDENSTVVFNGNNQLQQGVYVVFLEGNENYFDFIVNADQHFSIVAEIDHHGYPQINNFINSPENERLLAYKKFMAEKQVETYTLNQKISETNDINVSLTYNSQLKEIASAKIFYRDSIIKNYPQTLLCTFLIAMKEPDLPDDLKDAKTASDSAASKKYIKDHFWDGVNFWDGRLANTQFFGQKFDRYFEEVLEKVEDTAIVKIDHMLSYASASKEMTHLLLSKLIYGSIYHRYKWGDEVFVHLFEKYIAPKKYDWLTDEDRKKISEKAYFMMGSMIGTSAPNIELPSPDGIISSLYNIDANYIALCFWDPTCSHCRETLPKMDSIYRASWMEAGIKIFAVANESDGTKNDWLNYINDHKLQRWAHVYSSAEDQRKRLELGQTGYSQRFDVWYYPSFFLLDKNKRFIAKKLNYEQLTELVASLLKKK